MKCILSLINNSFQDKMLEMHTRIRMVISVAQQDLKFFLFYIACLNFLVCLRIYQKHT